MSRCKFMAILLSSVAFIANSALAHELRETAKPTQATVPLYDNLGDYTHAITTPSKLAQRYFDQGLRLTYAFNHAEASRSLSGRTAAGPELCHVLLGRGVRARAQHQRVNG